MKKKFLQDKNKKTSLKEKKNYCVNFSKHLESLFEPLGHDKRDFKKLKEGEFFLDETINYDYEGNGKVSNDILICEKVSNKKLSQYLLSKNDHIEKLYNRLKELGK